MDFRYNLEELIAKGAGVDDWLKIGQTDEVTLDTMFLVTLSKRYYTYSANIYCRNEWAWFNDIDDYIDYITELMIPLMLCKAGNFDPISMAREFSAINIFNLPYKDEILPLKTELTRLYTSLKGIQKRGGQFSSIKKQLYKTNHILQKIDGEYKFQLYYLENAEKASKVLFEKIDDVQAQSKIKHLILKDKTEEENEMIRDLFAHCVLHSEPNYLDDRQYVLLTPEGINKPVFLEEKYVSNIMLEWSKENGIVDMKELLNTMINFLIATDRQVFVIGDLNTDDTVEKVNKDNFSGLLESLEQIKNDRFKLISDSKYEDIYDVDFYENINIKNYFIIVYDISILSQLDNKSKSLFANLLQLGRTIGIHFIFNITQCKDEELKNWLKANCSCGIYTQ